MKTKQINYLLTVIGAALLLGGCTLPFNRTASLQVLSSPRATVMLDDKIVGETPFFNSKIKAGKYALKLIPIGQADNILPYETSLELKKGLKTALQWNFRATEASSSGYVMTQEPVADKNQAVLMVVSEPSGAVVKLDDQIIGTTPIQKGGLPAKQYKIDISSPGYVSEQLMVNVEAGYKLIINFKLGQGTDEVNEAVGTESPGAANQPTPTPKPEKMIKIKDTPTGWLRVRSKPGISGEELAKVNPGDEFGVLDEENGWYKIEYKEGEQGWVSGTYVAVVEEGSKEAKTTPAPTSTPIPTLTSAPTPTTSLSPTP